jgi:Kef-type K+ transport system membrane component KefB
MEQSLPLRLASLHLYFFAVIGTEFNIQLLLNTIPLFLALLGVAIVTKIAAGHIGAKVVGFSREVSLAIGFLMNGRGMVELVIASIGFAAGGYRHDIAFNSSCNRACN